MNSIITPHHPPPTKKDKKNILDDAFNTDLLKNNIKVITNKLDKHLSNKSIQGVKLTDPELLYKDAMSIMKNQKEHLKTDEETLNKIIDLYLKTGIQVQSPGYMGRQFSSVIPLAGAFDLVNSIINQPSSFYEAAQLPNVIERIMADEFNQFIGWEKGQFAMITTSGGSLANLTAILSARNQRYPQCWSKGFSGFNHSLKPAIAISEDAHYSIARAAGIIGIGEDQIIRLPINAENQIRIDATEIILDQAKDNGYDIFCLIASAGTTSTGAFDPIDQLADITQKRDIWLHIDGAHGASLILSDRHRHKLTGIEKADSFVMDAHKMMFVPAMCTLLFYKNKEKSYCAFKQEASYVFEKEPDIYTAYDSAEQNFECTKRPLIMNLWVCWVIYGNKIFSKKIDYLCNLTQQCYQLLLNEDDFEPLHKPQSNILCFHYLPSKKFPQSLTNLQLMIRNAIREQGLFFISKVDINGIPSLRLVFMNHETTLDHVWLLLEEIRKTGKELLKSIDNHTPLEKSTMRNGKITPTRNTEIINKIISESELFPKTVDEVIKLPSFMSKIQECEHSFNRPYSKIDHNIQDALVFRRLQQIFNILMLNPAWKARIESSGIHTTPSSMEQWQKLPISDKETQQDLYMGSRKGLVVPLSHGGFEIVASGGTSAGLPVETVYSLRELHDTYKIAADFMGQYQLPNFLQGSDPKWMITTLADYQMWSSGTMVGGVLQNIPNINYIGAGPLSKDVFQHIMSYKGPKAIMGISQSIALLTELGEGLDKESRNSFRLALFGSGLVTKKKQAALKAYYPNLNIMSYFAATQAETIGLQLSNTSNYLASVPGLHFIEIVDENGQWVKEGEEGELVITRLHSNEAPLLRLKLGDRMIRRPRINSPDLKTQQFEFSGRSGDIIHLCDTQYAGQQVYEALCHELKSAGVFDLNQLAHEIQFLNQRKEKKLSLITSVDDPEGLNKQLQTVLGENRLRLIFIKGLIRSLSLFNKNEANPDYLNKSDYHFEIKLVNIGSTAIHRTDVGKVPLIRDIF